MTAFHDWRLLVLLAQSCNTVHDTVSENYLLIDGTSDREVSVIDYPELSDWRLG